MTQDEDNPETQATLSTRHRMKTIQRHKTQDEDNQNKKHNTEN